MSNWSEATAECGLSVIVVTSGRDTLKRTLDSIDAQELTERDEVLVVGNSDDIRDLALSFGYRYVQDGPFGCWGQTERQAAMSHAKGTHLLFMDDDDYYLAGAFKEIRRAVKLFPSCPLMFRMLAPSGLTLWISKEVACGNVSGTQFVVPNDKNKLGAWGLRYTGDFDFIEGTMKHYQPHQLIWGDKIIAGCRDQGSPAVKRVQRMEIPA